MKSAAGFLGVLILAVASPIPAQTRAGKEFQLTKVTRDFVATPNFAVSGGGQHPPGEPNEWLEIEAEFAAGPAITSELTLKYFVLFNGAVYTGEVTHVNVPAGHGAFAAAVVRPVPAGLRVAFEQKPDAFRAAVLGPLRAEQRRRPVTSRWR